MKIHKAKVRVQRPDGTTEIFPAGQLGEIDVRMRRFLLDRLDDVTGISGTGFIAEGVVFGDGTTVLRWTVALKSTAIYDSIDDLLAIHGHDGSTQVRWIDDDTGFHRPVDG
jgi:hypothetical protein